MFNLLNPGFILSLDYFYENINTYVINKMLSSLELEIDSSKISALKINSYNFILEMKYSTDIPIIGYTNRIYPNSIVNVTPTLNEIHELAKAGANFVYLDASSKIRPDYTTIHEFYYKIKSIFPELYFIGEVNNLTDLKNIVSLDFDAICIKGDCGLIDHCIKIINLNTPLILDCTINSNESLYDYKKYFDMGYNNLIINSKIFTPKYNLNNIITKVF